ncbi:MAG: hypothetical protein CM15mP63_1570 [Gammaproteobacteria bacterium]|nr:MAG: hypothetical protein CM15mP63_1570 [Gammaproteobacteria bacterium]
MTRILLNFILIIVLYMIYRKVPQRFALISFFSDHGSSGPFTYTCWATNGSLHGIGYSSKNFSASRAAMQPEPADVIA